MSAANYRLCDSCRTCDKVEEARTNNLRELKCPIQNDKVSKNGYCDSYGQGNVIH